MVLDRLGNTEEVTSLLSIDYTRPHIDDKPNSTQIETPRESNRTVNVNFEVR